MFSNFIQEFPDVTVILVPLVPQDFKVKLEALVYLDLPGALEQRVSLDLLVYREQQDQQAFRVPVGQRVILARQDWLDQWVLQVFREQQETQD
jgi:hypothetical protein